MGHALRVAVIGAGYFARFHHEAWGRIPGAELVGVADTDLAKAEASGAPAYGDAAAMLRETAPDIVDIATPPETHATLIDLALAARPKAVICQKPFCADPDRARAAVTRAAAAGVPLIVHENFRFQPWYRALKRELDAGRVGAVSQLTFRLRPGDGRGADAYLARQPYFRTMPRFLIHETGIHWIDTFRFLLGEPDWVQADLRRLNPAIAGEDAGFFLFGYADGRRALFDGNRLLDHAAADHRRTMGEALVEGETGTIRLMGDGGLRHRVFGAVAETECLAPSTATGFGGDCVHALQSHVMAHLRDGAPVENTGADYLRNLEIEAAIYAAAESGARVAVNP
jgi:predicted dehydrogenase